MIVVKLGGCNGSGKTTLAREFINKFKMSPAATTPTGKVRVYGNAVVPPALASAGINNVIVLGSYENVCGGMDTISDKEERLALVQQYAKPGTLLFFEGLITGKTFGAIGAFSNQDGQKGRWLYAYMGTSFNECVKRVLGRRKAAGNDAPFDPERTMRSTFKGCLGAARIAGENGHKTYTVGEGAAKYELTKLMSEVVKMARKVPK